MTSVEPGPVVQRLPRADLTHPAVEAVLSTAASLVGMEVVFLGSLTEDTFTFEKVHARGTWPGVDEGRSGDRQDSFCH